MQTDIDYTDVHLLKRKAVFIDLRTKEEFYHATIPGAINLPILNEDERKEVSILYNKKSHNEAKQRAVQYASEKLPLIYEYVVRMLDSSEVVFFCDRGGYRSKVLVQIMIALGHQVYRLKHGYKGYRQFINCAIEREIERKTFFVLEGYTGAGKTDILRELDVLGEDVLNLEGFANHRGSRIGYIGLGEQPSQKQFESLLYEKLLQSGSIVFVEGESHRIGKINLPAGLYEKMAESVKIFIEAPIEKRIERIKNDYLVTDAEELKRAIYSLEGYVNPKKLKRMAEDIDQGDYETTIRELLRRYDAVYALDRERIELRITHEDTREAALQIQRFVQQWRLKQRLLKKRKNREE